MDQNTRLIASKVAVDLVCLLTVGLPVLALFEWGSARPRGFFCNDESLMYPYRDSTISNTVLYVVGVGLPIVVMVVTEFLNARWSRGQAALALMGRPIPPWTVNIYKFVGVFLFGAVCSQLTTDIAKYVVGRLRPHFFDICQPNIDCSLAKNQHKYFDKYTCTSARPARRLKDVALSFPSGHSSFSAYAMLYLAAYLQARMKWRGSKFLRHTLQFICLMMSWGTAMSRIADYKHHWSDVLGGLIIGLTAAALTIAYVSDLFPQNSGEARLVPQHPPENGGNFTDHSDGHEIHVRIPPPASPAPTAGYIKPTATSL